MSKAEECGSNQQRIWEAASAGNMYPGQDRQRDERARLQRRQHLVGSGRRLLTYVGWLLDSCRRMVLHDDYAV
jgi:hypothetical protein